MIEESMKKIIKYGLLCCLLSIVFSSCIRDHLESCPPLKVKLVVKDKNYFNVDRVSELEVKKDENQPFKEYIPTLFYSLHDATTDEIVEEQGVFQVEGDEKEFVLPICGSCLPHGKYVLTVWGGLKDMSQLSEDRTEFHFHPEHLEGNDIYLTHDTLVYDYDDSNYVLDMERTKGKLIVLVENADSQIHSIMQTAKRVYGKVSETFFYQDSTYVQKHIGQVNQECVVNKMMIAPSCKGDSPFYIRMYDEQNQELVDLNPAKVAVNLERNMISALKYVYKDDGSYTIYVMINDSWKELHEMDIED